VDVDPASAASYATVSFSPSGSKFEVIVNVTAPPYRLVVENPQLNLTLINRTSGNVRTWATVEIKPKKPVGLLYPDAPVTLDLGDNLDVRAWAFTTDAHVSATFDDSVLALQYAQNVTSMVQGIVTLASFRAIGEGSTTITLTVTGEGDATLDICEIDATVKGKVTDPTDAEYAPHPTEATLLWTYAGGVGFGTSPAVADLDNDGTLEVVVGSYDTHIYCILGDGGFEWKYKTGGAVTASPVTADLDGDGKLEVVVGSADGAVYVLDSTGAHRWHFDTGGPISATAALGDVDGDGVPDIVVGSEDNHVYVLEARGILLWKHELGGDVLAPPLIVDVDGDGGNEVVLGADDGTLTVLDGLTQEVEWTVTGEGRFRTAPVAADLDGDGSLEVLVGSDEGVVTAIASDGSTHWTFRTQGAVTTAPMLADLDGERSLEVLVGSAEGGLYIIDAKGGLKWNTGSHAVTGRPTVGDLSGDGWPDIAYGTGENTTRIIDVLGVELWSFHMTSPIRGAPVITDLLGDGTVDLIFTSMDGKVYAFGFKSDQSAAPHFPYLLEGASCIDERQCLSGDCTKHHCGPSTTPAPTPTLTSTPSPSPTVVISPTPLPASTPSPTAMPLPTYTPSPEPTTTTAPTTSNVSIPVVLKANGSPCTGDAECESNNCRNKVCCLAGKDCCTGDQDCDLRETCETKRFYCVPEGGAFEFFMQYWELAAAALGSLGVIAYYLHILKRKTIGEEKVKVRRGVTREGNVVKIGVKVVNESTFPLVDVGVELDVPKAFRIEGGNKFIDLGTIRQDEYQSAIFSLVPTRCVSGNVLGSVIYHDVKNNRKIIEMEPVTVGSVCPFLEKVPMDIDKFKRKVKSLPSQEKKMKVHVEPQDVFDKLENKCSAMHMVSDAYSPDGNRYMAIFTARGAYSKNFIAISFDLDMASNELVIKVYGEQEEMITGLLSEIVEIVEEAAGMSL